MASLNFDAVATSPEQYEALGFSPSAAQRLYKMAARLEPVREAPLAPIFDPTEPDVMPHIGRVTDPVQGFGLHHWGRISHATTPPATDEDLVAMMGTSAPSVDANRRKAQEAARAHAANKRAEAFGQRAHANSKTANTATWIALAVGAVTAIAVALT